MTIDVAVRHRLGTFDLDVALASGGRLTAVFGPSGCGKTSVINVIAGLIRPAFAKIGIDGHVLVDTAAGIWLPAHRRRVGYVFQDARLFPHLSVRQNLGYGRWFAPKNAQYADQKTIIEMLGISHLLERKPHQLSGGEKQRVALGRALIPSPRLLLMDEPLASLDEARKLEVMPYIERLRDEYQVPIVYVSHSVEEVARLATDIAVLANGRVTYTGRAEDVMPRLSLLPHEHGQDAGALLEMSVISYDESSDLTLLRSDIGEARIQGRVSSAGQPVRLHIRARDVMIATEKPRGLSALNVFYGTISEITLEGRTSANVTLFCGQSKLVARITKYSCKALGLRTGAKVFAVVKTMSVEAPGPAPAGARRTLAMTSNN